MDDFGVLISDFSAQFAKMVLGEEKFSVKSKVLDITVRDAAAGGLRSVPTPASCLKPDLGRLILQ